VQLLISRSFPFEQVPASRAKLNAQKGLFRAVVIIGRTTLIHGKQLANVFFDLLGMLEEVIVGKRSQMKSP
jgi:hypothetical protein